MKEQGRSSGSARQEFQNSLRTRLLSAEASDAHLRWGKTASTVTGVLVALLILSIVYPSTTQRILVTLFATVGAVAVTSYLVFVIPTARYNLLKALLKWRGWAYQPRSTLARAYLGVVGVLGGSAPTLWELQPALPSLPVPDLAHTCALYLRSVEPLLTPAEFAETKRKVAEFQQGVGPKLQALLLERARTNRNWLISWWEEFVYLRGRMPIAIFSNWYGTDRVEQLVQTPMSRAANCVHRMLLFKQLIDTRKLEPNRIQDTVPLCMWQYSRIFGTVRVPGVECDTLEFHNDSRHIVVIIKEQYFKIHVYDKAGKPLSAADLQAQFRRCETAASERDASAEPAVAALTSQNRDVWAKQRDELLAMDEVNSTTLDAIESALFVLVFDESEPATVEDMAYVAMHRHGKAIWFDKNFNMIVTKNARVLSNNDHTWADAPVMVHVFDFVFSGESSVDHYVRNQGEIGVSPELPEPERLDWQLTDEMRGWIEGAQQHLAGLQQVVEVNVLKFQHFGKGIVKRAGMSPDAFCQAAIQLAYYRLRGEVALTYESGGTVRFFYGRTETVRSLSTATKKFCELMCDDAATDQDRFDALKASVKNCVSYMRQATNGDGADRHLMGLKVLALGAGMELPEIFTDKAYQTEFKLSSSQTAAYASLGGGFAPIAKDGYGVSYVVNEERLWFHISCYREHPLTDSQKYADALSKALLDMRDVVLSAQDLDASFSHRQFRIQRAN